MSRITGASFATFLGLSLNRLPLTSGFRFSSRSIKLFLIGLLVLSSLVVRSSANSLSQKQGLPLVNQLLAWTSFSASFFFLFIYPFTHEGILEGLSCVYLSVIPSFILLSLNYEVLFYVALAFHLFVWLLFELQFFAKHKYFSGVSVSSDSFYILFRSSGRKGVTMQDARRAVIYVCFSVSSIDFKLFFFTMTFFIRLFNATWHCLALGMLQA